jgi:hypothetical protein
MLLSSASLQVHCEGGLALCRPEADAFVRSNPIIKWTFNAEMNINNESESHSRESVDQTFNAFQACLEVRTRHSSVETLLVPVQNED